MIDQVLTAPKQMPVPIGLDFAIAHQLGYEIPGFTEPALLDAPDADIALWQERLVGVRGLLSLHGPVYDLNPVSLDPRIAETTHLRYQQSVRVSQALGVRYLVLHTQYNTLFTAANVKDHWLSASIDYWQEFAETQLVSNPRLTVVLENFMEETPDLLRALIEGINHPQVKACLDTGHANLFSHVPLPQWLDVLEHHVAYIHSHNNYGQTDDHRGYGFGTLDMEGFLTHLMRSPYKINLALEIFHPEELGESYAQLQRVLEIQQAQLPEKSFLI